MIIYGGNKEIINKQLSCSHSHNWTGPYIDKISRYWSCSKCYCHDRDIGTYEQYSQEINEVTTQSYSQVPKHHTTYLIPF